VYLRALRQFFKFAPIQALKKKLPFPLRWILAVIVSAKLYEKLAFVVMP